MKHPLESSEVLAAYATIDYNIYLLKKINDRISKIEARMPIEIAVDNATGYSNTNYLCDVAIVAIRQIIDSKKIINADYSKDLEMLNVLKERKKKYERNII